MAKGNFTIELDELDLAEMENALTGLGEIEKKGAVKKGLQEGVKTILDQGKKNLRTTLSKDPINVASREKKRAKGGYPPLGQTFTNRIKTKRGLAGYAGFRRPGGNVAHLVDKGTKNRWTKAMFYRGSVSKGKPQQGSNFWTSAVQGKAVEAIVALLNSVRDTAYQIFRNR